MQPSNPSYLAGAAFGLTAVTIWAGWSVLTRLAVTTNLDAWDITALRFGVAGILLSPVLARRGLALDRLGWLGLATIIAGVGAPYVLVAASGLRFAPASDQGALNPGCMPLFVALITTTMLGEQLSVTRKFGLSLVLTGAVVIVVWHASSGKAIWGASRTLGDALFLLASFLTACFTVVMRQVKLEPLHAASIVATGSLVFFLPIYFALHGTQQLIRLHPGEIIVQVIFQGVLVTIISIVLYGRAVAILGASAGAAFGALVPALSALFAIPLLAEWPSEVDWISVILISTGVNLASGGPLPFPRPSTARPDK
jgi:drug/metabolite transporter (DMT)-like permease